MKSETKLIPVDAAGRRLSVTISGTGEPTVILETGLEAESEEWGPIQDVIARETQVIRYDRANRGASDPAPKPRSARDSVDDLHVLVQNLGLRGRLVLVGHSLGGLIVRLYAYLHPNDVAALVLIDPMHEDQFERISPLLRGIWPNVVVGLVPFIRRLKQFWSAGWRDPTKNKEGADLLANQILGHSILTLGDIPLVILTSGAFVRSGPPGLGWPKAQREWVRLNAELLRKSTRSRQVMVERSNHFIQRAYPEVVIDAIHSLLRR